MNKPRNLKVVSETDQPPPPPQSKPPTTITAAINASERDLLVTLRAKRAADLDGGAPAHTVPQLMKQLRELDKDIRALDAREKADAPDASPASGGAVDNRFDASAI